MPAAVEHSGPLSADVERGRLIYEQGILPDGGKLTGVNPQGFVLKGREAACAACHRRSGYGGFEGNVMVPPITAAVLSIPGPHFIKAGPTPTGADATIPWYRAMTRPAYDDSTLARAIREGRDPDGDALTAPMPRFALDDASLSALLAYLRQLSAEPSPGIEHNKLHLATVITPDAPNDATEAVLGVLRAWTAQQRGELSWELHEWRLAGPPETWEKQLGDQYRRQPVFAVLSGAGGAEWSPVHRFCEHAAVACILPSLEVAPDEAGTDKDFFSLYYSPGVELEAELLAGHLKATHPDSATPGRVVQIYGDATGKRAVKALTTLVGDSSQEVADRKLRAIAPAAALAGISPADALVLWLRPPTLMALVAQAPEGPPADRVFISALLAPPEAASLPPAWKARITYLSLFDDWDAKSTASRTWLATWLQRANLPISDNLRPQADAYGACYFFARALASMQKRRFLWRKVNLTRTYLLERLESAVAKNTGNPIDLGAWVPLYARLSLAADRRIAAKGGYLLRYAGPTSNELAPIAPTSSDR